MIAGGGALLLLVSGGPHREGRVRALLDGDIAHPHPHPHLPPYKGKRLTQTPIIAD